MSTDQDNKRVSDAYREMAGEVTPAKLDEQILAMATREARSRYGLARAWVRPLAWAATIGISLAFMLELTWFADAPTGSPAPAPAVFDERARQDAEVMKAKQESSLNHAIAEQADEPAAAAPAAAPEASPLRAAEKQARGRAEAVQQDALASFAISEDRDQACDDAARGEAESWYECIAALREQGRDRQAAQELEALLQAFPDFREPAPE